MSLAQSLMSQLRALWTHKVCFFVLYQRKLERLKGLIYEMQDQIKLSLYFWQ